MTGGDPSGPSIEVHRSGPWTDEVPDLVALLERAARLTAVAGEGTHGGSISVILLPEEEMADMNRRWLGREGGTDVISFELGEDELMADVYIAPEVGRRRAEAEGIGLREELVRLVVHGTLHALGHDHPEDAGRWESEMYRLQERLVARTLAGE